MLKTVNRRTGFRGPKPKRVAGGEVRGVNFKPSEEVNSVLAEAQRRGYTLKGFTEAALREKAAREFSATLNGAVAAMQA